MKINERIKLIRTTEAFTQVEFAKLIGVYIDTGVRQIEWNIKFLNTDDH